jgi:ATP-dependent Clp endopeptidase proteolytic subunit ClpP
MKIIRLDGVVGWDITARDLSEKMEGEDHIKLVINSGGGEIIEGFSIINLLSEYKGRLDVQVDFAASMASVFAMLGDSVSMKKNSSLMMIHKPWGGAVGESEDLRKYADNLDRLEAMIMSFYVDKTGLAESKITSMLEDETWMNAQEAKKLGFIDEIDDGGADMAAVAMAGMHAQDKVGFNLGKFVAKLEESKAEKAPIKQVFSNASSLSEVEATMRKQFSLSRSEVTAIVSAVKNVVQSDFEPKEDITSIFNSLTFGE